MTLWGTFDAAFAQFVRKERFSSEHQRRMRYAVDDWVSYKPWLHFSNMAVGQNYLYVATRGGGILRYHMTRNFWDYPITTSNGLPGNNVQRIFYDENRSYLIAQTTSGDAYFDGTSQEWVWASGGGFWPYADGYPQIPEVSTGGDKQFQPRDALANLSPFFANGDFTVLGEWTLMDRDFQEYTISGYLIDRYERIWFPVDGFGIGVGQTYSQRADFYPVGLPLISPRAIAFQGADLWIGGIGKAPEGGVQGIALWPYEGTSWVRYQARRISHLPSDEVNAIEIDNDNIWFATEYGVSLLNRGDNEWTNYGLGAGLPSNRALDLEIMGNRLFIATDQGLSSINLISGIVERIKEPRFHNLKFNRLDVHKEVLWAATDRGIFRLRGSGQKWEYVPSKSSISNYKITALAVLDNEAWFATEGGVMSVDINQDKWQSFPQVGMEIRGPYRDIKADKHAVWVATTEGLLKYDRKTKNWRLFRQQDGLLDNDCYQLLLDGRYIWIATAEGVCQFFGRNPDRLD